MNIGRLRLAVVAVALLVIGCAVYYGLYIYSGPGVFGGVAFLTVVFVLLFFLAPQR